MRIDLHCHTKKIKSGDGKARNVTPAPFKEKIEFADVKIVAMLFEGDDLDTSIEPESLTLLRSFVSQNIKNGSKTVQRVSTVPRSLAIPRVQKLS